MAETECPHCHQLNDCHDDVAGQSQPQPGDVSLCWGCREVAVFDRSPLGVLIARKPTEPELAEATQRLRTVRSAGAVDPHTAVRWSRKRLAGGARP